MHKTSDQPAPSTIGQRIQALMGHYGWKEKHLLQRIGGAVNQSTLYRLRHDQSRDPRDDTLEPIARALGVTTAMLRGYEEFALPAAPPAVAASAAEERAMLRAELISEVSALLRQVAQAPDDDLVEIARQAREPLRRVSELLRH